MSTRVHPIGSKTDKCTCPCSVDGIFTCGAGCCFIFCVLLICCYFAAIVMGIIQFGTCVGNTLPVYMIVGGCLCILFIFIFTCWLCNRCLDTKSVVILSVLSLTVLSFGSIAGIVLIFTAQCEMLTRDAAIGFSCPVWLVLFIVVSNWCHKNFRWVTNDQGRSECVDDPINSGCPCCDCEEGASMLDNFVE